MPRFEGQTRLGNVLESGRLPSRTMSPEKRNALPFRIATWAPLLATLALVIFARTRLLGLPLERDEGEYAYTGQLLLHAIPPYKLAYSMKFPGTGVAYALLMSIFGQSAVGVHIGLIVINLIAAGLIFFLGRNIFGEIPGIAAAATYSVLSLMPHILGQAAHASHFVVLFTVAGTLVLIRALDRQSPWLIFTSGCLFGLASMMKQPGLFFVLFGSLYLLSRDWRAQLEAKQILFRNLLFCLGVSVPCFTAGLSLSISGVFGKFWFWTVQYATQYGSQVGLGQGMQILAERFWITMGTAWPIWAMAMLGLIACLLMAAVRKRAGFLVTFAFFSALAVCPGFYFRPHYFILVLPAVSLLAAAAVVAAFEAFKHLQTATRFGVVGLFAACLAWPLWSERDFFFERQLEKANRMVNGTNPFPESVKIGEYIREQSAPSDTIAVLGSEPQIYFYAQRRSATGYIYTYSLMETQPYAHQMQQEMINEIEAARPKFLVLVVISKSWLAGPDSDQSIFRWADRYCDANYDEVGLINISEEGSNYYFSGRPANVKPTAEHILIYRRKT